MTRGLETYTYPKLEETVYYKQLKNGLSLYLIPRKDYHESYAMLTSFSGSLDTKLTGTKVPFPEGVAHFLEHKLFEMPGGRDVLQDFTNLGADVNAFTTFDRTSYYFSTSQNLLACLDLLQDFVQTPYFDEESIVREQGIITQEIEMYQDDVDYRLYLGILKNLYPRTALSEDIAGSVDSIKAINKEVLESFYTKYYHPSNLSLVVVGNFDVKEVYKSVNEKQESLRIRKKKMPSRPEIEYYPVVSSSSFDMDIVQAKLAVGFRCRTVIDPNYVITYRLSIRILFALLFGMTSTRYQSLYEGGKVDHSFDFEVEIGKDYQFVVVTMDTQEPIVMSNRIRQAVRQFASDPDVNPEHFDIVRKEIYGEFLRDLNYTENTVNQFMTYLSHQQNYFDVPNILEELDYRTFMSYCRAFIDNIDTSDFVIFPK